MEYRFELPVPPSTNQAYATNFKTGRRFKAKDHQKWQEAALTALKKMQEPMTGRLEVIYTFHFATPHRRDISNYEKLATDTLVKAGIIKDDSLIDRLVLNRGIEKTGNMVGIVRLI